MKRAGIDAKDALGLPECLNYGYAICIIVALDLACIGWAERIYYGG